MSAVAPGLRAPAVIDPEQAATRTFRAAGTPMAVRVDASGRIASELVAGVDGVLSLLQATAVSPM